VDGLSPHKGTGGIQGVARGGVCLGVLLLLGLSLAGCGSWRWPRFWRSDSGPSLQVLQRTNRSVVSLSADDIVTMMLYLGFTGRQTLELGEDLRNALMTAGAAEVRAGKKVQALFAAREGGLVWIATQKGGTFVYDARSGRFGLREDPGRSPSR